MTDSMTFEQVVSTTRSMRRLDPHRDIEPDTLEYILRCATYAPSGGNAQPVRWVVVTDAERRRQLGDIYRRASVDIFAPYRQLVLKDPPDPIAKSVLHLVEHFGESPVVIAACTRDRRTSDESSPFSAPWDNPMLTAASTVWPAVQNLCLAARSVGIGTTPTVIHNIIWHEVADVLGVPPEAAVWCLIPLGYPLGAWGTPKRKPVEAVTYRETWGASWRG
ncbi:MAG: hypothetical protein RI958_1011 [Actinomycetota bacterium]|jgi:nitroreductase